MLKKLSLVLFVASLAAVVQAQTPGEYITAGGWGHLLIEGDANGVGRFALRSTGSNGHMCDLDGTLRDGAGELPADPGEVRCTVNFKSNPGGVSVASGEDSSCRDYCGIRADFQGDYILVQRACGESARHLAREAFLASYRARQYQRAIDELSPVLSGCAQTLSPVEEAGLRNDLAVAYFHLGKRDLCIQTLEPVLDQVSGDDLENLPPADFEDWSAIAKTTHFNQALCTRTP